MLQVFYQKIKFAPFCSKFCVKFTLIKWCKNQHQRQKKIMLNFFFLYMQLFTFVDSRLQLWCRHEYLQFLWFFLRNHQKRVQQASFFHNILRTVLSVPLFSTNLQSHTSHTETHKQAKRLSTSVVYVFNHLDILKCIWILPVQ